MAEEVAVEKRETQAAQPERIRGGVAYVPSVDIVEREHELLLIADMPGVKPEGVEIHYERGLLSIYGQVTPRQDPQTRYLLCEYGVGDFQRRFELGEGIDPAKITAELRDGVLSVHLPKAEALMPRRIAVKAG